MKRRGFLFGLAHLWPLLAAVGLRAQGDLRISGAEVKAEVATVIEGQLAALRAGDVNKAYSFASAPLRAQMNLRAFTAVIQNNYREIWANERAEIGLVRDDGRRARVMVHVHSKHGAATFDYVLVRERAGWRIGSVLRRERTPKADV